MPSKQKISVTVDGALLKRVERLAGRRSRSQVFAEALEAWVRRRGEADLDAAFERYYRSLTARERREDEEWATIAAESARHDWGD
jgi:metal-responsive CopG/Arc/MetJ family transcriptional regulator